MGTVYEAAGVFAVLEKPRSRSRTRRVWYLHLDAHERGGIYCHPEKPIHLDTIELAGDRDSPDVPCVIRFDEAGTRLWAADYKGRVYVTEFYEAAGEQSEKSH